MHLYLIFDWWEVQRIDHLNITRVAGNRIKAFDTPNIEPQKFHKRNKEANDWAARSVLNQNQVTSEIAASVKRP